MKQIYLKSLVLYAGQWVIQEAKLAYGGVAAKTIMAPKAAAALSNKTLSHETLKAAVAAVTEDVQISANAPGVHLSLLASAVCWARCGFMHVPADSSGWPE